jgi:hypothetical protein
MDDLGMEIVEKIEEGIITEEEYRQLVAEIGEHSAYQYVIHLKERYVYSPKEIEKIKEKQQLKKDRVNTLMRIRKETKVVEVVGKREQGVPDLEMDAHDDFRWDCIIYVDGHSNIDERVSHLKNYRDISPDLEVVTIASSEAGTYCLAKNYAIDSLIKKIKKDLTPMEVAIILNTQLREDPTFNVNKDNAADADVFLKSTVQISASTSQYYDRNWNFYERSGKPSGFLFVQNESILIPLLTYPETRAGSRTKLTKTEILRRALPFGRRPLFVDIGCLNYSTPRAKEIWETNLKTRGFILGGKKRKTRKNKR